MSRRVPSVSVDAIVVLLIICSSVSCQLFPEVSNSSLINSLFLNHLEHTLDRLTALSEVASLLAGGAAGFAG